MNSFVLNYINKHPVGKRGRKNRNWINFLFAYLLFIRASLNMMYRFEVLFNYRPHQQAHTQMWDVYDVVVRKKTRHFLLTRTSMCGLLVCRLIGVNGMNHARRRHLAKCVVTPFHFIGKTKNEAEIFFQKGKRLLTQCKYTATIMFENAALLMHHESYAVLSSIIYETKCPYNNQLSFKYASRGEKFGCPHSKGALALYYIRGRANINDKAKGLALAQESTNAGSCYGQLALGICYKNGIGVAKNDAEAVRLLHLSASHGYVIAQYKLGRLYHHGRVIEQNDAEAVKWYSLAAKQNYFYAKYELDRMSREGRGGA
jgi:TPR repeat protein